MLTLEIHNVLLVKKDILYVNHESSSLTIRKTRCLELHKETLMYLRISAIQNCKMYFALMVNLKKELSETCVQKKQTVAETFPAPVV